LLKKKKLLTIFLLKYLNKIVITHIRNENTFVHNNYRQVSYYLDKY